MSRLTVWLRTVGRVPLLKIIERLAANSPDVSVLREQASNPLEQIYYAHDDRRMVKWHHYLEIYDRHFSRFRGRPVRVLEIGVANGGSLQMWRRYFGEQAIIHGLDIDPRCASIDDTGIVVHVGSQADGQLLNAIVDKMGGLDILIDDGGHQSPQQIKSFEVLFPKISPEGIYLCEDLHASYWRHFRGGLRRRGSFMEYAKRLLDRLHAWYFEPLWRQKDDRFPYEVRGIFFYDSVVVIEKHRKRRPFLKGVGHRGLD